MTSIKDRAHHSVSLLLGIRKRVLCPGCGSKEWYASVEYIASGPVYSECIVNTQAVITYDFVDEGRKQFHSQTYWCGECGLHRD